MNTEKAGITDEEIFDTFSGCAACGRALCRLWEKPQETQEYTEPVAEEEEKILRLV